MKQEFKPGNLVRVEIRNFRSITELNLNFTPRINYFLAPNGHGKSSILMAIQLVLGSNWGELKQTREQRRQNVNNLIKFGEEIGEIKLYLCKQPFEYNIYQTKYSQDIRIDVIYAQLTHKGISFYYNDKVQSQEELRLRVRKLNLYVDNPFTSMMQLEAQKIMFETAYNKLRYVLQLMGKDNDLDQIQIITSEIREKNVFKNLQEAQNQFKHKKQLFQQGIKNYRQENQLKELKSIVKQLDIFYYCISLIDICKQIKLQQEEVNKLTQNIQQMQDERSQLSQQLETHKKQLDELEQRKIEQFRQMRGQQQQNDGILKLVKQNQIEYNSKRQNLKNIQNMMSNQTIQQRENLQIQISDLEKQLQETTEAYNKCLTQYSQYQTLYEQSKKDAQSVQLMQVQQQLNELNHQLIKSDQYNNNIQRVKIYQAWYMNMLQKHDKYFDYSSENTQFMIFPVIKYLYVRQNTTIPESTCKYILLNQLGNNFMNILTNSYQLLIEVSRDYADFNQRNRASSINQLNKQFEGKTYSQSIEFSKIFINAQQNLRQRLQTKLRDGEYKYFIDAIDGNPIVLQYFYPVFSQILYINQSTLQNPLSDHDFEKEINNILKYNESIRIIFTEKHIYTKLVYQKTVAAINQTKYDVTKISDELKQLVQINTAVIDDLEVKQKINNLKKEYELLQQQLNVNQLKKKTTEYQHLMDQCIAQKLKINHNIQNLKDEISEKKNELQHYKFTVTQEDLDQAEAQVQMKLNDLKKYIMQYYNTNYQAIQLIFSDDNTIAASQQLETQIRSLECQIAAIEQDEQNLLDAKQQKHQQITTNINNFNYQNNTYQLHRMKRQTAIKQIDEQLLTTYDQIQKQQMQLQDDLNEIIENQEFIDKMIMVIETMTGIQLQNSNIINNQTLNQNNEKQNEVTIKTVLNIHTSNNQQYVISAGQLGNVKDIISKRIKAMQGKQTQNLPQLQQELKSLIQSITTKYAFIFNVAIKFIQLVNVQNKELKQFVNQISTQLVKNLQYFHVTGHLELKLWTGMEYQLKFNQLSSFFSDMFGQIDIGEHQDQQQLSQTQINTKKSKKVFQQQKNNHQLLNIIEGKVSSFFGHYTDLFMTAYGKLDIETETSQEQSDDANTEDIEIFASQIEDFKESIDKLDVLEHLLLNFNPGINVVTNFSKGEQLHNISLSGGEKSVISLCLAGSCQQSPLILIDEINQGMDEIFETAAHNLILSFSAQTLISSPKISQFMDFDQSDEVAVHILMQETGIT